MPTYPVPPNINPELPDQRWYWTSPSDDPSDLVPPPWQTYILQVLYCLPEVDRIPSSFGRGCCYAACNAVAGF
eukprot:175330-Prorocentrum_minimum.AAC.4